MRTQPSTTSRQRILAAAASATLVLLVWGDESSAGIEGTGRFSLMVASGPITASGGGSISVNGVKYDLGKAKIHVNGHAGQATQLAVGQVVKVKAHVSDSSATGIADAVSDTSDVIGPVSEVNATAGTFTVLGQTVMVNAHTVFGDGIQPAKLSALQAGVDVQVSAFTESSGELLASRIDLQNAGTPLQIVGAVEALDSGAQTFQLNALTIDYSQAKIAGKLADGSTATVWAVEAPSAGTLHVTRIRVTTGLGGLAGTEGDLEGLVTSVASNGNIYVGDQLVIVSPHVLPQGLTLAPNMSVHVQGTFNGAGALVAKSISAQ